MGGGGGGVHVIYMSWGDGTLNMYVQGVTPYNVNS